MSYATEATIYPYTDSIVVAYYASDIATIDRCVWVRYFSSSTAFTAVINALYEYKPNEPCNTIAPRENLKPAMKVTRGSYTVFAGETNNYTARLVSKLSKALAPHCGFDALGVYPDGSLECVCDTRNVVGQWVTSNEFFDEVKTVMAGSKGILASDMFDEETGRPVWASEEERLSVLTSFYITELMDYDDRDLPVKRYNHAVCNEEGEMYPWERAYNSLWDVDRAELNEVLDRAELSFGAYIRNALA